MKVPFNQPYLTGREEEYVLQAIRSLKHSGNRDFTLRCVEFLENRFQVKKAYLVPSGTDALEMGCMLLGLQPGDEVILPSYTFSSTANAVVLQGATPVFVDIREDTFNLDENLIEAAITPRTKAILPIVYGGVSPEIDRMMEIARAHRLTVFEDAAQGVDATYRGRPVGSIAHMSIYSFHETKNHGCGEGGAFLLNEPGLERQADFLQEKGTDRSLVVAGMANKYSWVSKGSSFLLSDILSAFLLAQLEEKQQIFNMRKAIHDAYSAAFEEFVRAGIVRFQAIPAECGTNYHAFYLLFPSEPEKVHFLEEIRKRGVSAYIGYVPLHSSKMGVALGNDPDRLPVTNRVGSCIARMPLYTGMTGEQLRYVIDQASEILKGMAR